MSIAGSSMRSVNTTTRIPNHAMMLNNGAARRGLRDLKNVRRQEPPKEEEIENDDDTKVENDNTGREINRTPSMPTKPVNPKHPVYMETIPDLQKTLSTYNFKA